MIPPTLLFVFTVSIIQMGRNKEIYALSNLFGIKGLSSQTPTYQQTDLAVLSHASSHLTGAHFVSLSAQIEPFCLTLK